MDIEIEAAKVAHLPGQEGWRAVKAVRERKQYLQSETFQHAKSLLEASGEWRARLTDIEHLYARLDLAYLYELPFYVIEQIQAPFHSLENAINDYVNRGPPSSDSHRNAQRQKELSAAVTDRSEKLLAALTSAVAFQSASSIPADRRAEIDALVHEMRRSKAEAAELAERIREMADAAAGMTRRLGVDANASHFGRQAIEHSRGGTRWLVATTLASIGAAAWAVFAYAESVRRIVAGALTGPQLLQLSVAKLLVLSVIVSTALWCSRIYRAHRHNYIVNKHRQNALSTFETFVSATHDSHIKDAILTQATASIFAPQHTGYGEADGSSAYAPHIIETARNVTVSGG